jgi:hypothetical protein
MADEERLMIAKIGTMFIFNEDGRSWEIAPNGRVWLQLDRRRVRVPRWLARRMGLARHLDRRDREDRDADFFTRR